MAPIALAAPGWLTLELPVTRPTFRPIEILSEPAVSVSRGAIGWETGENLPTVPLSRNAAGTAEARSGSAEATAGEVLASALATAYAVGLTLLLGLLARSLLLLRAIAGNGTQIDAEDWRRRVFAEILGTHECGTVELAETARCSVPFVWGWRSVTLLIPNDSRTWPAARLKGVLIHEMSHVAQRDVLLRIAAEVLCAFQWMNPLTWMVAHRLRADGEAACDDAVLAAGFEPTDYAGVLLGLGIERRWYLRAAGAMSGGSPLGRRIEAVLDARRTRSVITRPQRWRLTLCVMFSFAVLVAADWKGSRRSPAPDSEATEVVTAAPRPPPGPGNVPASPLATPADLDEANETVPVHVRWASGPESGAAFLHGSVDLDGSGGREGNGTEGVGRPGFFLLFHRTSDGSIRSAHVVNDENGTVRRGVLADPGVSGWGDEDPEWIARDLPLIGLKLQTLGERVRWRGSPLSTYVNDPSVPRVSGSVMTGLPATTEDGTKGLLVAGWQSGEDRVGLLACGAPGSGTNTDGARALLRRTIDREGDVGDLLEGECLVAFAWNADRAQLLLFESYRAFDDSTHIRFSDGSRTLPDASSARWLLALLSSGASPIDF